MSIEIENSQHFDIKTQTENWTPNTNLALQETSGYTMLNIGFSGSF